MLLGATTRGFALADAVGFGSVPGNGPSVLSACHSALARGLSQKTTDACAPPIDTYALGLDSGTVSSPTLPGFKPCSLPARLFNCGSPKPGSVRMDFVAASRKWYRFNGWKINPVLVA